MAVWERGSLGNFGRALYDVAASRRPAPRPHLPGAGSIDRVNQPDLLRQWLTRIGLHSTVVQRAGYRSALASNQAPRQRPDLLEVPEEANLHGNVV